MWDCIKCGNPRDFASDPNHDPYDICQDCRVNYGWIDQGREARFKEFMAKILEKSVMYAKVGGMFPEMLILDA